MKTSIQFIKALLFLSCLIANNKIYSQAGTLDKSFGKNGSVSSVIRSLGSVYCQSLTELTSHKIISLEVSENGNAGTHNNVILYGYNEDGTIDKTFGKKGEYQFLPGRRKSILIIGMNAEVDNTVLVSAYDNDFDTIWIIKVKSNGLTDSSFGTNGTLSIGYKKGRQLIETYYNSLVVQPDGKFIIPYGVNNLQGNENSWLLIRRFNINGSNDSNFNKTGTVIYNDTAHIYNAGFTGGGQMALQPNGKILFTTGSSNIIRYNSNGSRDWSFGVNGYVKAYNDGFLGESIQNISVLPDGRFMYVGDYYKDFHDGTGTGTSKINIYRFNKDGSADVSFARKGKQVIINGFTDVETHIIDFNLQQDGKYFYRIRDYINNDSVSRYNTNGSLDANFGIDNKLQLPKTEQQGYAINALSLLHNDQIISNTTYRITSDSLYFLISRYNNDSSISNKHFAFATQQQSNKSGIKIYPNPAKNYLQIDGLKDDAKSNLLITDVNGKIVKNATTFASTYTFNIQNLPAGVYYLVIRQDGKTMKEKFIK